MQDKEVINSEVNIEEDNMEDVLNDMMKEEDETSDTENLIKKNYKRNGRGGTSFYEKKKIVQFILVGIFIAVISISIQFFIAYQFSKVNQSSSPHITYLNEKVSELSKTLFEQNKLIQKLELDRDGILKKMDHEHDKLSNQIGIRVRGNWIKTKNFFFFILHLLIILANQVQKELKLYHPFSANIYNNGIVLMFQFYSKNSFLYGR